MRASRDFFRQILSRYVPPQLVDQFERNPHRATLGGEGRALTGLVSDIHFATISELLNVGDFFPFLNRYLSVMTEMILDNHGTIGRYEDSLITCFFDAQELADSATHACDCAVEMIHSQQELGRELSERFGLPMEVVTRIGIESGEAVVGDFGTERHMQYTAMGLPMQIARRLQSANTEPTPSLWTRG